MANAYDRVVKDLKSGELTVTMLGIAVREWITKRTDIPEGIKNLLVQKEQGDMVYTLFHQVGQIIGACELAYRRGVQAGNEGAHQSDNN